MPLNFSAAHSSRIAKKPGLEKAVLKRSASSPFAQLNRRKPLQRSHSKPEIPDEEDNFFGDRLDDVGLVTSLATDLNLRDVAQVIQHVRGRMFESMPVGGGFSSTRIAEILNFRKSLPPTVTVTHVHALISSPTTTEKEISELTRAGAIRKIVIPGRGTGSSSVGEGLVLWKSVEQLVNEAGNIDPSLADKFLNHIQENPRVQTIDSGSYCVSEIQALMRAGFLTSTTVPQHSASAISRLETVSTGTMTSISSISKAASGSVAAVGGEGVIYSAGGRGGMRRSSSQFEKQSQQEAQRPTCVGEELQLSLPGTGPYLRLLTAARTHLVSLVTKSRFREMPLYLLKEKWDGGVSADDPASKAKKYRGEFAGVLPSRTRKWKQFYGLSFDWVLEECLGGGLIEVFEAGAIGRAVRIP